MKINPGQWLVLLVGLALAAALILAPLVHPTHVSTIAGPTGITTATTTRVFRVDAWLEALAVLVITIFLFRKLSAPV